MLSVPCPYCGPRDETEFVNGGEGHVDRPVPPEAVGDADWAAYLFFHDNPKGHLRERWLHAFGCRRWFHAIRSTADHAIALTYPIDAKPDFPA